MTTRHSTSSSHPTLLIGVQTLGRCFALLSLLVAMLIAGALFPHGPNDEPPLLLRVLEALILLASVYALSGKRWTMVVAIIIAVPTLVAHVGSARAGGGDGLLDQLRIPSMLVFNLFACVIIMRFSVRSDQHVRHRLSGATSGYLLLGFAFAGAYAWLDMLAGPVFNFNGQPATNLSWMDLQYFSLATLTTVGYGDFTPRLPLARALAVLEALSGVLFVAVFISALVGEAAAAKTTPPAEPTRSP